MIRTAAASDLSQIMEIIESAKAEMRASGNNQWNEEYPREEHLLKDIEEGVLYIYEIDGAVAGLICINEEEPEDYGDANWSMEGKALTLHRLAVHQGFRGHGVGVQLISHADVIAAGQNIRLIKTDTNSQNRSTQSLLAKCGYTFTGEISLGDHPGRFYCYEKVTG